MDDQSHAPTPPGPSDNQSDGPPAPGQDSAPTPIIHSTPSLPMEAPESLPAEAQDAPSELMAAPVASTMDGSSDTTSPQPQVFSPTQHHVIEPLPSSESASAEAAPVAESSVPEPPPAMPTADPMPAAGPPPQPEMPGAFPEPTPADPTPTSPTPADPMPTPDPMSTNGPVDPMAPLPPTAGIVTGSMAGTAGMPGTPIAPGTPGEPGALGAPGAPGGFGPALITGSMLASQKKPSKKLFGVLGIVPAIIIVAVLLGGSAAAYFGYVVPNQPENVWKTALKNTGKGYDKLVTYTKANKDIKAVTMKGSFKLTGPYATDGNISADISGENSQGTIDFGVSGTRVTIDEKTIAAASSTTPDVYVKVTGIKGAGSLLGETGSAVAQNLDSFDGQWIVVDHTYFDNLANVSGASSTDKMPKLSSDDYFAIASAVGDVSKQYVFTSDQSKAVVTVVKKVGKEKQDNRTVYHYKVGVNKDNLKDYFTALRDKLKTTKLGTSGTDINTLLDYDSVMNSIKNMKADATADAYVDMHTKLIHKIRFTDSKDPTNNYTEIGQDFQGGSKMPFFLTVQDKEGDDVAKAGINMTLDTKANTVNMTANLDSGGKTATKFNLTLDISQNKNPPKIEKPTGTHTLVEVMSKLGLGDLFSDGLMGTSGSTGNDTSKDGLRKDSISFMQGDIMEYGANHSGKYPTSANLASASWVKTNMPDAFDVDFVDPAGKRLGTPGSDFTYTATGCTASGCTGYSLSTKLDNGTLYTVTNLSQG